MRTSAKLQLLTAAIDLACAIWVVFVLAIANEAWAKVAEETFTFKTRAEAGIFLAEHLGGIDTGDYGVPQWIFRHMLSYPAPHGWMSAMYISGPNGFNFRVAKGPTAPNMDGWMCAMTMVRVVRLIEVDPNAGKKLMEICLAPGGLVLITTHTVVGD